MRDKSQLKFKISSALKNLIGKELITNEYIAVFELVKNAFDAHAGKATIIFEGLYGESPKIIIKDDGKGMNYDDLIEKWLFVAYSAKKEGTEDDLPDESKDYRDKIYSHRVFAGAKGVGRFSCDRLGDHLNMITIKNEPNAKIENLETNWSDFEKDAKDEFMNIAVSHKTLKNNDYGMKHGTVLEISGLHNNWDRSRIQKLKHSLEKLINPNQQNDLDNFSIEIIAPDEIQNDKEEEKKRNKVNGLVNNFLFETLNLKTTQILSEISEDGEFITTTLKDRGKLIYKIKEKNRYRISNIKIHLFQLNRQAKFNFTSTMGIEPVKYGSVFLYKNGFRIFPFGEEGEDPLQIDKRKAQGYNRFLGSRDLIGRIEINGENKDFTETTSRDGGLIKNESYYKLKEFFIEKALRRLEKYAIDTIKWGDPYKIREGSDERLPALNPEDVKKEVFGIISRLSKSKDIIDLEYDKNFLDIIKERQEESVPKLLKNFSVIAEKTHDPKLQKEVRKAEKQFKELLLVKDEIEKEADAYQEELKQEIGENLFLKSISTTDIKEVASLQHHIDRVTDRIRRNLDNLTFAIKQHASQKELLDYVNKISFENSKISTVARFVTKANFNVMSTTISQDLVTFMNEYIENVYKEYKHLVVNKQHLKVEIDVPKGFKFHYKFRPLEIIIIIDNLLSNAFKAKAKKVKISFIPDGKKSLKLSFLDDGIGVSPNHIKKLFDFGFSTTDGSGIGLYHVKQVVKKMNGTVNINEDIKKGTELLIRFKK